MDLDWRLMGPLLLCWLLCMLVTGPGMWSEKWGHAWLKRAKRLLWRDEAEEDAAPKPKPKP